MMKNSNNQKVCCPVDGKKGKGLLTGILSGILPHTFCILFIIFTILGAATVTSLLKPFLLNPYFFYFLIGLSFFLATVSAIIYLKKNEILSFQGIKIKWRYLSILYGTTISVNLILFMVIFPIATNLNLGASLKEASSGIKVFEQNLLSSIVLEVAIPCPGHAPLITTELKKINGVENIRFNFPNKFEVSYDSTKTSKAKILALGVFNTYQATVLDEKINQSTGSEVNPGQSQSSSNLRSCCPADFNQGGCGCGCQIR